MGVACPLSRKHLTGDTHFAPLSLSPSEGPEQTEETGGDRGQITFLPQDITSQSSS